MDKEFDATTINFLNSNDAQNGIQLLRFILGNFKTLNNIVKSPMFIENQHSLIPICQINVPVKQGNLTSNEFTKRMERLLDDIISQNSYFLMHIKEANDQWNFFLVNTYYEECLQQYFKDPIYS